MKEPWTVYIPCCCCCNKKRSEQPPPKPDPERGESSSTDNSLAEISPAERAIDIALRHSSSSRSLGRDMPEEETRGDVNPPPSYDSVLKDDDLRNPQRRGPAELHGSTAAPRFPPPVATGKEGYHQQPQQPQPQVQPQPLLHHQPEPQESVFSDEDDVVLTPPTTAPPTVIDEDSDDERYDAVFRR